MDINNIELPTSVIAGLYQHSLVDMQEEIPKEIVPSKQSSPTAQWKSLGDNRQQILIMVDYPDATFLPDNELTFLTGMLNACKMNIGDVAIVNAFHYPGINYKEVIKHFRSKTILLFGIEPSTIGLPLSFPYFQVQAFAGNSFLYAPVLKDLETDKLLKTKLWASLQQLFKLK